MWALPPLEQRVIELDFSSAGLAPRYVTRLLAGSVVFANAVELTDWQGGDVQLIVCEKCGIEHCQYGGWMGPRRAGDYVVFAPDSRLFGGSNEDRAEFRPPEYVRSHGWPFAEIAAYEALRGSVPELPAQGKLFALTRREVVAICQWEAPAAVLGLPFERPALRRDLLLAVDGDASQLIEVLAGCLAAWVDSEAPVTLERDASAPEFFVDVPGTPTWRALANVGDWTFRLEPGLVARDRT